jgi:hypothetical protein
MLVLATVEGYLGEWHKAVAMKLVESMYEMNSVTTIVPGAYAQRAKKLSAALVSL